MNRTKREKILLIMLSVIALLAAYYKFILSGRLDKIKEMRNKSSEYTAQIQKLTNNSLQEKKLNKDIKIINAQIYENVIELFPSIKQEKIIVVLNDMIEESGIESDSLTISKPEFENLKNEEKAKENKTSILQGIVKEYENLDVDGNNKIENNSEIDTNKENNSEADSNKDNESNKDKEATGNNSTEKTKKIEAEAEKMTIAMNFKGSYDNVMTFIDGITNFDKRIIIKNISLTADESNLVGNLTLEFYAVPKFSEEEDIEYLNWDFQNEYGKINPFFDNSIAKTEVAVETKRSYDFSMNVVPISSDLPTVILGKTKDSSKKSYVISDNPGIETVEISLTQAGGKYYYKHKNGKEAYPKHFNGSGVIFTPLDNTINLSVFSSGRNSSEDISGVNVKVYNNTDKEFIVDIKYDDKNKPRVNVIKGSGKITVNRN